MKTTDKPLLKGAQLVQQPELITVKTISPKIVDQMAYIDGQSHTADAQPIGPIMEGAEIIGSLGGGHAVIVRLANGHVKQLRCIAYIMYLVELGASNDEANEQYKALPQLFAA
jgi:hypothetical protein